MKRIFVSYSHHDSEWKDLLVKHLSVLEMEAPYDIWDDKKIEIGSNWLPEIEKALDNAHIAILMLSADFLASPFIRRIEIPRILERREKDGLIVIPIFVSPCAWQKIPRLSRIQGYPNEGKTLAEMLQAEADKVLVTLTIEIDKIINKEKREQRGMKKEEIRPPESLILEIPTPKSDPIGKTGNVPINRHLMSRWQKRKVYTAVTILVAAIIIIIFLENKKSKDIPINLANQNPKVNTLEKENQGEETLSGIKTKNQTPTINQPKLEEAQKNKSNGKVDEVKKVKAKAQRMYKNDKGFWEADFDYEIKAVFIPAGEFNMGSENGDKDEKPVHQVYLDGFWLGKTKVTKKQFRIFAADTGYRTEAETGDGTYGWNGLEWEKKRDYNWRNPGFTQGEDHPVVCVSLNDAVKYCQWLSQKIGLTFGLPTEAQWEKAARGTDNREYPWGNHTPFYKGIWYCNYRAYDDLEKRGTDGYFYTSPVSKYPQGASPYGLMDMAGNAWEWCTDLYGDYPSGRVINPIGPVNGGSYVIRSGSWFSLGKDTRSTVRYWNEPSDRWNNSGFRIFINLREK